MIVATAAFAAEDDGGWEFGITAYPAFVRGGEKCTAAIAGADRGALHLEARYDCESVGTRTVFVGSIGATF
jgi:hypothetical protein